MCGICGIIDSTTSSDFDQVRIRKMCSRLQHRGPDDEGIYSYNGKISAGLGHRRLSIIDLSSAGHQPMANEDKTIWIVFNGEVYNYKILRKSLEDKGHVFNSDTDTEAVVHLYEEYGDECVKHIRGMFAFALWDEREEKLLLARDRVGKKPLVYFSHNGLFCFASEFDALLASDLINKDINYTAIDSYLTYGYVPSPSTIYKNVFKLSPGHVLSLKDNKITVKEYWNLDYNNKLNISEQEAKEEILRLLKEAVSIRLYSDVPLGAFLSGGIDSSTVVAIMSQLSSKRVKTFSIGFEDDDYNELGYAKNIAKKFDTEHHELIVKPNAMEILPLLVERYGEPYADSSCIPTYYVSSQTKRYVTVALNGDGGDESFAGYERYKAMLVAEKLGKLPHSAKRIIQNLSGIIPDSIDAKNRLRRVKRFIKSAFLPYDKRYVKWVGIFDDDFKNNLYSDGFTRTISRTNPVSAVMPFFDNFYSSNMLDNLLNMDVHSYLPDDLLVKVDIASMANSLEARSPFLDNKLMEFAARLPVDYKLKGFSRKYILKKTIGDMIPHENIYRRKMGFGVPVGKWFRNELKGFLREKLLSDKALKRGHFNPGVIKGMAEDHIGGRKDYTLQLWALLMLELWYQRFID